MLVFYLFNYKITVDPIYAVQFMNDIWAKEPVGALSVCIAVSSILISLTLKIMDWYWDARKERARQGKLKIELSAGAASGKAALIAVISNIGREPVVLRDIGSAKKRLFGTEFKPVALSSASLPHALNARELIEITITEDDEANLTKLLEKFQVRDSLGKLWDASDAEIRRAHKQLALLKRKTEARSAKTVPSEAVPVELG